MRVYSNTNRDEPAAHNNGEIIVFPADSNNFCQFQTKNNRANKKQWHKKR